MALVAMGGNLQHKSSREHFEISTPVSLSLGHSFDRSQLPTEAELPSRYHTAVNIFPLSTHSSKLVS